MWDTIIDPNFITIWYHSCKHCHGKDQPSAGALLRQSISVQRDAVHMPTSLTLQKSSCRVLEHLWLREQPGFPSRSGVFTQEGSVCFPLCTAHLQSLRWKLCAGEQGRQVRCHMVSHLSVCGTFIQGHSFDSLPLLCKGMHREWPSALLTKQAPAAQAARGAAISPIPFPPFHKKNPPITPQCSPNKTPNISKLSLYS